MAQLTVRQAAQRVGISRQTMFRKIKDGVVSATVDHFGQKQIDTSELLRVFGALQSPDDTGATVSDRPRPSHAPGATAATVAPQVVQIEIERLRLQLEFKAAELALAQQRIDELKQRERDVVADRERLLALLEQQTRLLTAPPATAPAPSEQPPVRAATRTPTRKTTTTRKTAAKAAPTRKAATAPAAKASSSSTRKTAAAVKPAPTRKAAAVKPAPAPKAATRKTKATGQDAKGKKTKGKKK